MQVISTNLGFVLSFSSLEDLEGVIEHLQGQAEYIRENNVKAPHLYMTFSEHIPVEEVKKLLDSIKPI